MRAVASEVVGSPELCACKNCKQARVFRDRRLEIEATIAQMQRTARLLRESEDDLAHGNSVPVA